MNFGQEKQLARLVEISALTGYLKGIEMLEKYAEKSGNREAWHMYSDNATEVCNITDRLDAISFPLKKTQTKLVEK